MQILKKWDKKNKTLRFESIKIDLTWSHLGTNQIGWEYYIFGWLEEMLNQLGVGVSYQVISISVFMHG